MNTAYIAEALNVVITLGLHTDQVEHTQMPAEPLVQLLQECTYTTAVYRPHVVIGGVLRSTIIVPYPPHHN